MREKITTRCYRECVSTTINVNTPALVKTYTRCYRECVNTTIALLLVSKLDELNIPYEITPYADFDEYVLFTVSHHHQDELHTLIDECERESGTTVNDENKLI